VENALEIEIGDQGRGMGFGVARYHGVEWIWSIYYLEIWQYVEFLSPLGLIRRHLQLLCPETSVTISNRLCRLDFSLQQGFQLLSSVSL
jgi:hypothetical protein